MTIFTYSIFVADYNPTFTERSVMRVERTATKKKPHMILEAYSESYDADCLIAIRIIDWWTLETIPSFYIPSEALSNAFEALGFRIDFIP